MRHVSRYHAIAFMMLCLLVAAVLRLPDLPAVPPGLHYDEAANGILAAEIGLEGERPLFIPSYTGKEVLFFYLAGGVMHLLGTSVFALRLTAAFVGLLTIAATYWLGREWMLDRRIVLVATALMAVSFWHLVLSRLGFRAITQPLLQALAVAAFFRGVRRDQWGWLAAGGVFLGLTAYTYLAARLFPVLLLLAILPLLFNVAPLRRLRWRQLTLFIVIALVVAAPLLRYFAIHPQAFWVRIGQVAPGAGESLSGVWESYLRSLAMFFLSGDPYWRFNLPDRPLFSAFWGAFLVVGWVISLLRLRRVPTGWQRSLLLLLVLTPLVMILPTALATGEIVPSNLRAVGLIPFIFYLPAVGLTAVLRDLEDRLQRPVLTPVTLSLGLFILVVGGAVTYQTYFRQWATAPALYYASDGDLAAVSRFLDETDLTNKTVYVAAEHYRHPTLAFLSNHYQQIKWLPDSQALVLPAGSAALYLYPHNSPAPGWAKAYLPAPLTLNGFYDPDGEAAFTAYELAAWPTFSIPNQVNVNFDNRIVLLGYEVASAAAGETMSLTLFWQVHSEMTAGFIPFVHLEDTWGHRWSQVESRAYPAEQWQPGELIIQRVEVPVPAGTPPGAYRLQIGLFTETTGARLPQLDAEGRYAGDAFAVESTVLATMALPDEAPQPPWIINQTAREGLRLLGYERGSYTVQTGEAFDLAFWWQATEPLPPLTIRLELMRADNTGRILLNTQPVHDTYPFAQWATPQFLIDQHAPRIPKSFSPGEYQVQLRLLDAVDETLLTADLGPLRIEETERLFEPPKTRYPQAAVFGNEIKLLGYDLQPAREANQSTLTLVWQALKQPAADYTVFVHLLNTDGTCCVWQQDTMPQQGEYPTTRWLMNEVVVDTYQITLPPAIPAADYPIEVGLYLADTGRRLQVTFPDLPPDDAVDLRPLQVKENESTP